MSMKIPRYRLEVCAAGLGAAVLGVVGAIPMWADLLFLVILLCGVLALFFPSVLLGVAVASLGISPEAIWSGRQVCGLELSTVHNAVVLLSAIPLGLRRGLRRVFNPVVVAAILLLFLTLVASNRDPLLPGWEPFEACAAMMLGPFLFELRFGKKLAASFLKVLAWMPVVNVVLAIVLAAVVGRPLARMEFGVFRLQGAAVPSHLGVVAMIGSIAALCAGIDVRAYLAVASIDMLIVFLTGTRSAIVGVLMVLVVFVFSEVLRRLRHGGIPARLVAGSLMAVFLGFLVYGPQLSKRFVGNPFEGYWLNTSGRVRAWEFFWEEGMRSPVFGLGLGASTVVNQGQVNQAFRVPHNEFIRFFVDGGFVGLGIWVSGVFFVFARVIRQIAPPYWSIGLGSILVFVDLAFVGNAVSNQHFAVPFWVLLGCLRELSAGS